MSKQTNKRVPQQTAIAKATGGNVNWPQEIERMEASAKQKGGSRGDALHKVAKVIGGDDAGAALLRERAGDAGAQAFIEQPRNVLHKLPKLARCIAAGTEWCDAHALSVEGRRTADASVAASIAAIINTDGMTERQKGIIAACNARYPGGANAQMPASMEALAFFGIVKRADGAGKRNVPYIIVDEKAARALLPKA